jgi:hypothetical protein
MQGPRAHDAIEKLEASAMAIHTVGQAAGLTKGGGLGFTREELEATRDAIDARVLEWQRSGRPRTPEYHTLEGQAFIVRQWLKDGSYRR